MFTAYSTFGLLFMDQFARYRADFRVEIPARSHPSLPDRSNRYFLPIRQEMPIPEVQPVATDQTTDYTGTQVNTEVCFAMSSNNGSSVTGVIEENLVIIDFGKYEGKSVAEVAEIDRAFYERLATEKENGIFA